MANSSIQIHTDFSVRSTYYIAKDTMFTDADASILVWTLNNVFVDLIELEWKELPSILLKFITFMWMNIPIFHIFIDTQIKLFCSSFYWCTLSLVCLSVRFFLFECRVFWLYASQPKILYESMQCTMQILWHGEVV